MKRLPIFLCILMLCLGFGPSAMASTELLDRESLRRAGLILLKAKSKDPLKTKLAQWLSYTHTDDLVSFEAISTFILNNPDWPMQGKLRARAEEALGQSVPDGQLIAWFKKYPPQSHDGAILYFEALRRKDSAAYKAALNDFWGTVILHSSQQKNILARYQDDLTKDAHIRRLNVLLINQYYKAAQQMSQKLGSGYVALTNARIALAKKHRNVTPLIKKIPKELMSDPGLLYERLRWRREKGYDDRALEILKNSPPASEIVNPKGWWKERHIIARRFMEEKQFGKAFEAVAGHRQTDGFAYAQAEFLKGWLALRFVNKAAQAPKHFENIFNMAETPVTRARAAYWAGRAYDELKQPVAAKEWYGRAANYQTVYYGQIAATKIGAAQPVTDKSIPTITGPVRNDFLNQDLVKAARIFHALGYHDAVAAFLLSAIEGSTVEAEYYIAADLALNMGYRDVAIAIAKMAERRGMVFVRHSFPVDTQFARNRFVEPALVHSIIRQESRFYKGAISSAGARGLMQLMPATAREMAGKQRLRYNAALLLQNPGYNVQLGSAYLEELLGRFDGSYVLTVAAYNAGPGRVRQWMELFGDPRKHGVDTIDWIELIPVYETRNYVQRVMENLTIYRTLMHNPPPVAYNIQTQAPENSKRFVRMD